MGAQVADSQRDEVSLLEEARARLEATLATDENWRALMRGSAFAPDEDAAARRARDTRLEMALADNGIYCAWRHVGEAIAALRGYEVDAGVSRRSPQSELPQEIAELIRRRADEEERSASDEELEHPSAVSVAAPSPPPPVGSPRENAAGVAQQPLHQEAAVTFVARELAATAVERTAKRLPLRDRLRDIAAEPKAQARAFSASKAGNEEADVTILTAEAIEQRALDEGRKLAVARFRKALFGESS
jgi:hypothetical protein